MTNEEAAVSVRAEAALKTNAEAYRLAQEAVDMRADRDRYRAVLEQIAEGCGHARCHAYPWIRMAQKALRE
jgi:O-acetyl-ADP-ribose deacetylase (regulator of RNase III)